MRRLDIFQAEHNDQALVLPGHSITQTFISQHSHLSGLRLQIYNNNLGGDKAYLFALSDDSGRVVREHVFKESNIGWGDFFRYDFPPISNSANQTFSLTISSLEEPLSYTDLTTSELASTFISLPYYNQDVYTLGTMSIKDATISGDLAFQTYYSTSVTGFITSSIGYAASKLAADPAFTLPYLALMIAILIAIIKQLFKPQ